LKNNTAAGTVVSNEREIYVDGKIIYMPIYFVMFMDADAPKADDSDYFF
jgi:hypothetical protein